ncbi:MAG TPA: tRNA 2-thiouridine(34) synthase MnmA [Acidimicrobiales bacterium]|nr:tRNA 2-thiouridine(34) synthase MnmA [Acidimicrobiales bacterium]
MSARPEVLVAMSGGVDSSVAAAVLLAEGYRVTGVTMKLWGGESDTGCCSVSDVDDARRVAQQLGIDHHVFNFGEAFDAHVVQPYVADHAAGRTPNPCIECNRHIKFDRLLQRARQLGIELIATGHHARVVTRADGTRRLARGADLAKDQSYVLHMLGQEQLAQVLMPVGSMTKAAVRSHARQLRLRTATKPDSQDVCFIASTVGRERFLRRRVELTPGRVVDTAGRCLGTVPAVELVTIGQRKHLGLGGGTHDPRFAVGVDTRTATVTVGTRDDLLTATVRLDPVTWAAGPAPAGAVQAQVSAHGDARPGFFADDLLTWAQPQRRVAPGQSVVLYDGDEVLGGGLATHES